MQKIALILVILFILPVAYASDFGAWKIKLYHADGTKVDNVDINGGTIEAQQGDEFIWRVYLKNTYNQSGDIDCINTYSDDIDFDIPSCSSLTIGSNTVEDDYYKEVTFKIPLDEKQSDYDIQLKVAGTIPPYNGNSVDFSSYYNYTLSLTTETSYALYKKIDNITKCITDLNNKISDYSSNTSAELKMCRDVRAMYEGKLVEKDNMNLMLLSDKNNCTGDKDALMNEKNNYILQIANLNRDMLLIQNQSATNLARAKQAESDKGIYMVGLVIAVIVAIVIVVQTNKKNKARERPSNFDEVTPSVDADEVYKRMGMK